MGHEGILALIIIGAGSLAGVTNYLFYYFKEISLKKGEFFRYLFSSIGAALLVPLLLNMLSSDLIKNVENYNPINYFVFAGFCFVAGYFSDRFINSIGEKLLKDIENTKAKADTALNEVRKTEEKADIALNEARKTEEKIDILVSNETEMDDELKIGSEINLKGLRSESAYNDEEFNIQMGKIVKSFGEKYKFRTYSGIAKELNYQPNVVKMILEGLEQQGAVKRFTRNDGKAIWALTNIGKLLSEKKL